MISVESQDFKFSACNVCDMGTEPHSLYVRGAAKYPRCKNVNNLTYSNKNANCCL